MPPTIFICGATGTQGGAITNHLLKHNIYKKTITRSITSPSAQSLQSRGVTITEGDFDNDTILRQSLTGCTGLFLNLKPELTNPSLEVERAQKILSIAKESGVTTVDPTNFAGKIFLSKQAIENEVRTAGFQSWTILRPGNFMSNFLLPMVWMYQGLVDKGVWLTALTPETQIPMVDPNDIGQFGAEALLDPARFHEKGIEIASEMLGVDEILEVLSRATGKQLKVEYMSQEEIDAQMVRNPVLGAQLLMRDMGLYANLEQVYGWGFKLGTFKQFLEREKEQVTQTYASSGI